MGRRLHSLYGVCKMLMLFVCWFPTSGKLGVTVQRHACSVEVGFIVSEAASRQPPSRRGI